jgi:polysaccharide deacetylase family protein (PEP-CTERM system associated)
VDVEDWFNGIPVDAQTKLSASRRLEVGLNILLKLLAENTVHATFFVLGPVARDYPGLMRQIADGGHEIGCHGWSHDLLYEMDYRRLFEETHRATDTIAGITGQPVVAYRAAYFSVTRESLWALELLATLGYRYDSSIFPVRNWRYGIADFAPVPQRLDTEAGPIYEFPLSVRRVLGRNLPASGGAYFRLYPYSLTRANIQAAERTGSPVVFYLHPWELDPDHPRIGFYWKARITHYANLGSTKRKLSRLLKEFRFAPLGEVLDYELDGSSP